MLSLRFAAAIALLWGGVALASLDLTDLLFRPNLLADKSLMEHAKTLHTPPMIQTQEDTSVEVDIDLCNPENFHELFQELMFAPERYTRYKGLDHTSLFASSVTLSDKYAVIGSNGYDVFKGIVHVYVPKTVSKWSLQALIRSPVFDNGNFGNDVSIDDERMVVAANAYQKYDGIVFVYERNLEHQCWLLTGTIKSPLAEGPNRTYAQGFGYRVDMSGDFLIASTSVNNAYIFKERNPGNWTLHTNLEPPAPDIFFGRAVAIENDTAIVGAYGYDRNVGRVFIYKHNAANDTWDLAHELQPLRNESNFGYAVDMHGPSIIVGANGYYKGQFENHKSFDARMSQPSVNFGWAYVFQQHANGSGYYLEEEIASPVGNNSYFGTGVGIYGDSIIVGADGYPCFGLTGAGFVYNRGPDGWKLNQSYPSPAGHEGHFGYAVDINANYSAIGAYGFDNLRGSIYLADRTPHEYVPPFVPTFVPTMAPSAPSEILSGGTLNRKVGDTGLTLGMILALALGALIVAGTTGLVIYCCCCMVPIIPVLKKKKKKEEDEDSPYTVHSYAGYVEDEYYVPPAPVVLIEEDEAIKKDMKKEKDVKYMENGEVRKMFPYKVYGPRGYTEEGNDSIPEDLLVRKKEEEQATSKVSAEKVETRYEYSEEVPLKGLPPAAEYDERRYQQHPPPPPLPRSLQHMESFQTQQSQYSEHRTSLVERARQTYESNYSMHSAGSEESSLQDGAYHSMSSLTGSYPPVPHGAVRYLPHKSSASTVTSHRTSFGPIDEEDDATVITEATSKTSMSTGSLVNAAKERYKRLSSEQQQYHATSSTFQQMITTTTTTTSKNLVSSVQETYTLDGDASSVVTGSDNSSASGNSFVQAAKDKYARLQSSGANTAVTSAANSEFGGSLVDKLKARGAAFTASESGFSEKSSHVLAARSRYASLQRAGGIASASADAGGDGDTASVSTHSSQQSTGSVVQDIKAKYAKMRAESASASASTTGSSVGNSSLVDEARAKYRTSLRSESSATSSASGAESFIAAAKARYAATKNAEHDDESTVATHSSTSSQVDIARAKYAALQRARQEQGQGQGSDSGSVTSGSSSLVEEARARGEALRRQGLHSASSESDAQSASQASGDQSSMVSAIKARYAASKQQDSTDTGSVYSSSAYSSSTFGRSGDDATRAQASDTSVAVTHSSESQARGAGTESERSSGIADDVASHSSGSSSVDSARSAAMNKFAFYKAKVEAEARAKALGEQSSGGSSVGSSSSGVAVMLKERVAPLRRRVEGSAEESSWTLDDTEEGVSKISFGDEATASNESSEDIRARAMAKAREKYALAKQQKAEQERSAARASEGAASGADGERSRAVEEAMRRLRESQNASAAPVPTQPLVFGTTTTVLNHSKASSTTKTVSESAAHSLDTETRTTAARQETRSTLPKQD